MSANNNPIYTLIPKNTWGKVTAADTTEDGTSAGVVLVYTAQASDGGFIQKLIFQPISTSGSTTTSAASGRIYLNNGSTVGSATNNLLIGEITLPATAVNLTATAAALSLHFPLNFQMQAGYQIYVGVTAIAANTQWNVLGIAGNYS
jgi:hypothetical protein